MSSEKKPKWEIGTVILKGKQTVSLFQKYEQKLMPRLQADEFDLYRSSLAELEKRQSGQEEQLVSQKATTKGQNEAMDELHETVVSIRNIAKSASPTPEIAQAFGVGVGITNSVSSVLAASNMVVTAYQENPEWSNEAGIIEADMEEIAELQAQLSTSDDVQESSKFTRKASTMSKNALQRRVEDEITKLSAIGIRIFQKEDPAVARLFADLIPG